MAIKAPVLKTLESILADLVIVEVSDGVAWSRCLFVLKMECLDL
jgi:hypothetical protein